MTTENKGDNPLLSTIQGIVNQEWQKTKSRELAREEEVSHAILLIGDTILVIRNKPSRCIKVDRQFNKNGRVAMSFHNDRIGFLYKVRGNIEHFALGVDEEEVKIKLIHGVDGVLDAKIKYLPDWEMQDFVIKGMRAVQRANGVLDKVSRLLKYSPNSK